MSHTLIARGAILAIATAVFALSARASDTADAVAEKFARESERAQAVRAEAARKAAEKEKAAQAAAKREAARKALATARRLADAKKARAAEAARRSAALRRQDEEEMLRRARREADERRAAEVRRLIERAERERAKSEALLAGEPIPQKIGKLERPPAIAEDPSTIRRRTTDAVGEGTARAGSERNRAAQREPLLDQTDLTEIRAEEARRLAEKLNHIREARETRQGARGVAGPTEPDIAPAEPPSQRVSSGPVEITQRDADKRVAASYAPPPGPPLPTTIASDPGKMALGAADSPQHDKKLADAGAEAPRRGGTFVEEMAPPDYGGPDNMRRNTFMPRTADGLRVTVLLAMAPGDYGIRRGSRTADPILCTQEGCYVSTGADRPARLMPGWQALGFGNVWGVRAGACSNSLTCIFRGVQLGQLPASVQPVDMHILRHDGRLPYLVLTDSGCGVEAGRLICTDGVHTENYAMWIVPEQVAEAAGAAALRRALAEGLDASRAEVSRLAR